MVSQKTTHFLGCQIATSKSVKQHKLRKRIALLSNKTGEDFISLYIPTGAPVDQVVASLKEAPECDSPKQRAECKGQETAITQITKFLQSKRVFPENGIAIFAGTFVLQEYEQEAFHIEEIVPPEPIANYLLQIGSNFQLQPLREMLRDKKVVGIIALDSKEANFGLLEGERLETIETITSGISGKTKKGGQSQRRYERERDMAVTGFFHRIADHAAEAFLGARQITVLLLGGPGHTKADFLKGNYLNYALDNVVLNSVDTQSAGKEAFREILNKSESTLKSMCSPEEKKLVQRLMSELAKQDGLATYGLYPVLESLKKGSADIVLVTDDTEIEEISGVCEKCGLTKQELVSDSRLQAVAKMRSTPCVNCRALEYETREKDIVDVLEDAASKTDARVEVISSESPEKASLTALGGIAALLRYRPADSKG